MKNRSLIVAVLLLFSITASAIEPSGNVRQRMQQVVPFDLSQATETFSETVHGGVQHVVAKSPNDARQIKLIQQHLQKIAEDFHKGDFSATERIHGPGMPGLKQLKKAEIDDIKFEYKPLPDGGQIHYSSEWPQYVEALHQWFNAQKIEHGDEKLPGHTQHHASPSE